MDELTSNPAPRTPLSLEVSFKRNYAREESKGVLKNISVTGAFLEDTTTTFKLNEKLNLMFYVAGRERKVAASVIWINSSGCGVKFLPQNNRDVQIVDDLIYFVESGRSERRDVISSILKKVG
jgi:hypothetical protein